MNALEMLCQKNYPLIMGVLNITPDSFSDGGKFINTDSAVSHAKLLEQQGAAIIDIGGESTGPGAKEISAEIEWQRIEKTITALAKDFILSVDTYKSDIAKKSLELGAHIINDVSAMRADSEMARIVADYNSYVVIMHSKEDDTSPHATNKEKEYKDVVLDIIAFLEQRIEYALKNGIHKEQIILDPGMGKFLSNDANVSWEVLHRFDQLCSHFAEFPVLIGVSRKGFLGGALHERDEISQKTTLDAVGKGGKIVRTHNVGMMLEYLDRHC